MDGKKILNYLSDTLFVTPNLWALNARAVDESRYPRLSLDENWEKTWELVEEKYHKDKNYTHTLCCAPGADGGFSIDAKLNGAYHSLE